MHFIENVTEFVDSHIHPKHVDHAIITILLRIVQAQRALSIVMSVIVVINNDDAYN